MHLQEILLTLKNRREVLNVTQAELAELSKISLRTFKAIEKGTANPTLLSICKIIDVLGMELQISVKKINK